MKISMRANSEEGLFDKIYRQDSSSNSIVAESVENSQEENKEHILEKVDIDNLPGVPKTKSDGKKTFDKDLTNI